MSGLIIAIDGYSSTGKGTFAKEIASRLGIPYLDSGALYRSVTLYGIENGIIGWNGEIDTRTLQQEILLGHIEISFCTKKGDNRIFLGNRDVSERIRQMDVASNVSPVAALPFVRNFVDAELHRIGGKGCVMDGRDIGTAVFPNADLKIFMVADAQTRARRRVLQMEQLGQKVNFEDVLKNVRERDYTDSHRAMNPLRQAEDAIVLDNSNMSVEEQMVWLDGILREKFNISLL